jgi:hypothetical protein
MGCFIGFFDYFGGMSIYPRKKNGTFPRIASKFRCGCRLKKHLKKRKEEKEKREKRKFRIRCGSDAAYRRRRVLQARSAPSRPCSRRLTAPGLNAAAYRPRQKDKTHTPAPWTAKRPPGITAPSHFPESYTPQ